MKTKIEKGFVSEATLVEARQQGLSLISPLKQSVNSIDIATAEDYAHADEVLTHIRQAKSHWISRINPIIEPIRSGLDLLYGLRKDIVDPMEAMEATVKEAMKGYKLKEVKKLREAEEARQKELQELERQAAEKEEREDKARTKAMRDKLSAARAELEQHIAIKRQVQTPAPVKAAGSSAYGVKKYRVRDMQAFVAHVLANWEELGSLISLDGVQMNAYFKLEPHDIGEWLPGVDVFEDINIAGRKG